MERIYEIQVPGSMKNPNESLLVAMAMLGLFIIAAVGLVMTL
jgi:hypothetical protein